MTEFAKIIQNKRKEKEYTLEELAGKLGVGKSYLSKLENDRVPAPSKDFIKNIAEVLFLDHEQLSIFAGRITESMVQGLDEKKVELFRAMKDKKISDADYDKIRKIIDDNKR